MWQKIVALCLVLGLLVACGVEPTAQTATIEPPTAVSAVTEPSPTATSIVAEPTAMEPTAVSTAISQESPVLNSYKTLYIGAERSACNGMGVVSPCLPIKDDPAADYYYSIEGVTGFTWEVGYEYELFVEVVDRGEKPDAAQYEYKLVKVVSQTPVKRLFPFESTRWMLQQTFAAGAPIQPQADKGVYFQVTGDTVSGSLGCSPFNGTATVHEDRLSFNSLTIIQADCHPDDPQIEDKLLALFTQTRSISFDARHNVLQLQDEAHLPLGEFSPALLKQVKLAVPQHGCPFPEDWGCFLTFAETTPTGETIFYLGKIAGFTWQDGYEYQLLLTASENMHPQPDEFSWNYELVEILEQKAAPSTD